MVVITNHIIIGDIILVCFIWTRTDVGFIGTLNGNKLAMAEPINCKQKWPSVQVLS